MKRTLSLIVIGMVPVMAHAAPSSSVAWTPETLQHVQDGNADHGQQLAQACQGCHGSQGEGRAAATQDGEAVAAVPALAGQLATYTYKQLRDYRQQQRGDTTMNAMAAGLSDPDIADLAAWYSRLPLPEGKPGGALSERTRRLVEQGDSKHGIPPCQVCHEPSGRGSKMDIPALAGQQAGYLADSLHAYKNGSRHNDIYGRMRGIAKGLSDQDIKELADYYQQLR